MSTRAPLRRAMSVRDVLLGRGFGARDRPGDTPADRLRTNGAQPIVEQLQKLGVERRIGAIAEMEARSAYRGGRQGNDKEVPSTVLWIGIRLPSWHCAARRSGEPPIVAPAAAGLRPIVDLAPRCGVGTASGPPCSVLCHGHSSHAVSCPTPLQFSAPPGSVSGLLWYHVLRVLASYVNRIQAGWYLNPRSAWSVASGHSRPMTYTGSPPHCATPFMKTRAARHRQPAAIVARADVDSVCAGLFAIIALATL